MKHNSILSIPKISSFVHDFSLTMSNYGYLNVSWLTFSLKIYYSWSKSKMFSEIWIEYERSQTRKNYTKYWIIFMIRINFYVSLQEKEVELIWWCKDNTIEEKAGFRNFSSLLFCCKWYDVQLKLKKKKKLMWT